MAEAEDVIVDAARHATVYMRTLWQRNRPAPTRAAPTAELSALAHRLDLLIAAVFGRSFALKVAMPPPRPSVLRRIVLRGEGPQPRKAVPATDGTSIWLPRELSAPNSEAGTEEYRLLALQQAARASRGGARFLRDINDPLAAAFYTLLEASASDALLAQTLPGLAAPINAQRKRMLAQRPSLQTFPASRRVLEDFLRKLLVADCKSLPTGLPSLTTAPASIRHAQELATRIREAYPARVALRGVWLLTDEWTGELRAPNKVVPGIVAAGDMQGDRPRSARLERRPEVREALPGEDEEREHSPWMVQSAQPHESAEDPMGMQRPTDRDESTAAEDYAESLSELSEARLVSTPGSPKEILLSEDAPEARAKAARQTDTATRGIAYPEWDYRAGAYRDPGARVFVSEAIPGDIAWVDKTLAEHRAMVDAIRRRFEMLRAQRMHLRKQKDGDDIDLDAFIESRADFLAGRPLSQQVYKTVRPARRDTAIALLVDISGSTDSWIAGGRRVIDVEREALLLVCLALDSMGEAYSVQAFSGEGPNCVTLKTLKSFDETYSASTALRIAGLEPERYTRAGAAIRHSTATLMQRPARHRLLLLLSDGKPNDADEYEGRYGVEDMRQAVNEAKLQGVSPFCLTVDRQGAAYLPQVFGRGHYAVLMRAEALPGVLLEWIRRLIAD